MDACLLLLFQFFSTKPRDQLGRTSPKSPILCRLACKTLTQSISQKVGRLQSIVWLHVWVIHCLLQSSVYDSLSDYNVCGICLTGWHCILLGLRLFLTGAISSAVISFRKCVTRLVVFTICYHLRVTLNLPPGSEMLPHILDLITEPLQIIHPQCSC